VGLGGGGGVVRLGSLGNGDRKYTSERHTDVERN